MTDVPSDEGRIDEILRAWREARDRGEAIDAGTVIAQHPDLADTLRARFEAMAVLDATLGEPRAAPRGPTTATLRPVDAGRYADFRVLGQGGMGIVYWALDTDLNRQVAFKVVRPDAGQSGDPTPTQPLLLVPPDHDTPASQAFATLKARFLQEAWVTAGLEHPGIVPVYEVGRTAEGVPYYTMRFVRGSRTLAAAIDEVRGKPIDERLALLEPFLKVCDTIRYAHAHGVIHRDLKPDNIALGEFGEVVVLDWGLAKMTGTSETADAADASWQERIHEFRTASDFKTLASAMGTPGYMAPESALGRVAEVDQRSDVYALGALLFQILTGRLPYDFRTYGELAMKLMREDAPDAASLDATVPAELSAICASALARDRTQRTDSADALASSLRTWLAQREQDRETQALLQHARAGFDAAKGLTGDLRIRQLDKAASAASQVLARRPDDAAAAQLQAEIDALRETGVEERSRAVRRTTLRRAGIAALVFLVVGGAVVAKVLDDRRLEAVDAKVATEKALVRALSAESKTARESAAKDAALARATEAETRTAKERDAKDAALVQAEGRQLLSQSQLVLAQDPALALRLAVEGAARDPGIDSSSAVVAALLQHRERLAIKAAGGAVRAAVCATGGNRVLTCEEDRRVRIRDLGTGSEVFAWPPPGESGHVTDARFLPGERRIAIADSESGSSGVVDVETGQRLDLLQDLATHVSPSQWSEDGRRALVEIPAPDEPGTTGTTVWDADRGRLCAQTYARDARLSPDGAHVLDRVTLPPENVETTRLLDAATGAVVATRANARERLLGLAFLGVVPVAIVAGVETFATRPLSGATDPRSAERTGLTVRLVDVRTGAIVQRLVADRLFERRGDPQIRDAGVFGRVFVMTGDDGTYAADLADERGVLDRLDAVSVSHTVASPDGRLLAGKANGRTVVWDVAARARLCELPGSGGFGTLVGFTADSRQVVTYASDGALRVWDVAAPRAAMRPAAAGSEFVGFALGGSRLVVEEKGGAPSLWNAETGVAVCAASGRGPSVSADGRRVAWLEGGRLRVLDAADGREIASWEDEHGRHTELDATGRRVLTWSPGHPVRVLDVETRALLADVPYEKTLSGAAFVRGGSCVVVVDGDTDGRKVVSMTARCVEIPSGEVRWRFARPGARLHAVSRGDFVLLHSTPGVGAWLLSADDGSVKREIPGDVRAVDLSADGGLAATCDSAGTLRVWPTSGDARRVLHELRVLEGRPGSVDAVRVSIDGRRVAALLGRVSLVVWDTQRKEAVLEFGRDATSGDGSIDDARRCLDFTLGGRSAAAAFIDDTAVVLPVDALSAARAAAPRELTPPERLRYLPPPGVGPADVRAAAEHVRRLESTVALAADLRAAVDADPALSDSVRQAARLLVAGRVDDANSLNTAAWSCVVDPARPAAEYAVALERAVNSLRFDPANLDVLNTVGVAQYRCGRFAECLETLARSDAERAAARAAAIPADVAFLAMAHHRLGHAAEAQAELARLRELMKRPLRMLDPESAAFLKEAEELIEGERK